MSTLEGIWNTSVRSCIMRGNCERRPLRGNSGLILTEGRVCCWIETELQNRFQGQCELEFGILGSDDGLPEFLGVEGNFHTGCRYPLRAKHT